MSRPYDRSLAVAEDSGMIRIELTLFRNVNDIKVLPLYVTPYEAGQLSGMLSGLLRQVMA